MANSDFSLFSRPCPPAPPCEATDWTPTGVERCTAVDVVVEEVSNCGTVRTSTTRPFTWTPTGNERCRGTNVEREEANDCGRLQWVVDRTQTWALTGATKCVNGLIQNEEANDCGGTRYVATTTGCDFCPSVRISCDGQPGFGFHEMDNKDPAATVVMSPCPGDESADPILIYPTAGPGHTVKVVLDGVFKGYAANKSDCAPDCGCPKDPVITVNNSFKPTTNVAAPEVTNNFAPTTNVAAPEVTNNFAPTTNVAAPEVTAVNNVTLPAPNLVAHSLGADGTLTSTLSNGATVVSNPLPSC